MKMIALTRSASFVPFVDFLRRGGASVDSHLAYARISPEIFGSMEGLMPLQQAGNFISHTARTEGIEDLGLQVGAATPIKELGLFGLVLCQALTLNDLIQKLIRLIPSLDSGAHAWLATTGESTIELRLHHATDEGRAQIDAYALMLLIDAVRLAAGPDWQPQKASLDIAGGRLAERHEALSNTAIRNDVNYVAIAFPRHFLSLPIRRAGNKVTGDPELELVSTAPSKDLAESISQTIRVGIQSGIPTIEEAAELGRMSVRTLQRQLSHSGASYHELVDRARFLEALPMLEDRRIKLSEIAAHLGYSDAANFTRAFRRWTASSPREFRARLQ